MAKKLDLGDQTVKFTPDVLHIPAIVAFDPKLQPLDGKLYAVVYWLERLKDGRCWASNATLAKVIGSSSSGVNNSLNRLRKSKYIECTYDKNNHRKEIKTLVYYSVNPSSNEVGGVPQMSNIDKKKKERFTSDQLTNIKKVYVTWLRKMIIPPHSIYLNDPDALRAATKQAAKRCQLTETRMTKINARIQSKGLNQVLKAIYTLSESDWHKGENDSSWKASIEWLCKNDEKIEEWAGRE